MKGPFLPRLAALAALGFAAALFSAGCATVKTRDEMSARDIRALDESQSRINAYRERLKTLESDRAAARIGEEAFEKAAGELDALVEKEIALQKAIIRKDPGLAEKAGNLLADIGKAAVFGAAAVAGVAVSTLQALAEAGTTFEP